MVGKVDSTITRSTATPPHMAAAVDEPVLVELLLKLDANVDSIDEFGLLGMVVTTTLGLWMVSKDFMIMIMNLRIIPTMMMKFLLM